MALKDKLKACHRSKRSLTEQSSGTEENMLTIIDQYKEKVNLAASLRQRLEDDHAKVLTLHMNKNAIHGAPKKGGEWRIALRVRT